MALIHQYAAYQDMLFSHLYEISAIKLRWLVWGSVQTSELGLLEQAPMRKRAGRAAAAAALPLLLALLLARPQGGAAQGLLLGDQLGSTPSLGRLLDGGAAAAGAGNAAGPGPPGGPGGSSVAPVASARPAPQPAAPERVPPRLHLQVKHLKCRDPKSLSPGQWTWDLAYVPI